MDDNKKPSVQLQHNLYNALGETLLTGLYQQHYDGKIDPTILQDEFLRMLRADIGINLGKGYNLNLGYGGYIGDRKQNYRIGISKGIF